MLFGRLGWLKCGKQGRSPVSRGCAAVAAHNDAHRQWDTVPVCSSSAGEAPGIAVVQELLEFKKTLEGSKVNHPPALHFVGSALQLCS